MFILYCQDTVKHFLWATVELQANDTINDRVTYGSDGPQGAVAYLTASKLPEGQEAAYLSQPSLLHDSFWVQIVETDAI